MSEPDEDKEKLTRVEASLRERERQVYAQQAEFMNEREKEKERHVKEKATQHFMALMSDMVSIYWHRVEPYRDVTDRRKHCGRLRYHVPITEL